MTAKCWRSIRRRLVMTFDVTPEGMKEPPSRVTYELEDLHGATKLRDP